MVEQIISEARPSGAKEGAVVAFTPDLLLPCGSLHALSAVCGEVEQADWRSSQLPLHDLSALRPIPAEIRAVFAREHGLL